MKLIKNTLPLKIIIMKENENNIVLISKFLSDVFVLRRKLNSRGT